MLMVAYIIGTQRPQPCSQFAAAALTELAPDDHPTLNGLNRLIDDPRKGNPSPSPTSHLGDSSTCYGLCPPTSPSNTPPRPRILAPNSFWSFKRVWIDNRGTIDIHLSTVVTKMDPLYRQFHHCMFPTRISLDSKSQYNRSTVVRI
jgi:hypothetical protein